MNDFRSLVCACALTLLSTVPSFALASWFPPQPGGGPPATHSAPGPMIGAGLPALAALGGYVWYRFRRRGR